MCFLFTAIACEAAIISQIPTEFDVTHLAGGPGGPGYADGPGRQARFITPTGLWGVGGTLYVAEVGQPETNVFARNAGRRLRKVIAATGETSTLATLPDPCRNTDSSIYPVSLSVWADASDIYVGDHCLRVIYKIAADTGQVRILAGVVDQRGLVNGSAAEARFSLPNLLWGDETYVYLLDSGGLRRVNKQTGETTPAFSEYTNVVGGDGTYLYRLFAASPNVVPGTLQIVHIPTGEATTVGNYPVLSRALFTRFPIWRRAETEGEFLYAIASDNTVLRIRISDGEVANIAGGIGTTTRNLGPTFLAWKDGPGDAAELYYPYDSWADAEYLYFVEPSNHALRRLHFSTREVSTLAGLPALCCYQDGTAAQARFFVTQDVWGDGNYLYTTDTFWNTIRRVRIADGHTSTFAGTAGTVFSSPSTDGIGQTATFREPRGIWGDGRNLYVTERTGRVVRRISIANGEVTTLAGMANTAGHVDAIGSAARFVSPGGIWGDGTHLYVFDDTTIRTVNLVTREVRTLAGAAGQSGSTDGIGTAARFGFLFARGLWGDGANLYVADLNNNTIRKIVIATGEVTTFAGSPGMAGSADGVGANARFSAPSDIWGDGTYLYIADMSNAAIRRIRIDTREVVTIAGVPQQHGTDDGRSRTARFLIPTAIWGDGTDLYVAEYYAIRRLTVPKSATDPTITAIDPPRTAASGVITVTISGTNFVSGQTSVLTTGDGIRVLSVDAQSATTLTVRVEVAPDAIAGSRTLRVIRGDAASNPVVFDIGTIIDRTTRSFSLNGRGVTSAVTVAQPGAAIAGYARIEPAAGSALPAGFAVYGNRTGNVLVSEAAVPAAGLIQSWRVHFFGRGPTMTGMAIVNPTNQRVRVAYSAAGGSTSYADLSPGLQIAGFVDDSLPFSQIISGSGEQTLTFNTSAPVAVIALRGFVNERSEFLMTTLPVVDLNAPTDRPVIFPHAADGGGWSSQIVLVNPTDEPISGRLQFLSQTGSALSIILDGQTGAEFPYSLAGRRSQRFQTAGLSSAVSVGSIRVVADTNNAYPKGLVIFSYRPAGVVITEAAVPAVEATAAVRLYVEVAGRFHSGERASRATGFAIANPGSSAAEVRFELTDASGNPAGPVTSRSIGAGGQMALFLDQIPEFANLPLPFRGVLRISTTSQSGISAVAIRGRYNERGDFLISTADPHNEALAPVTDLFFPHFVQSGGYTTEFILFPASVDATSGTLRFFSQIGQPMNVTIASPPPD
ncbi:MAG: IPT/TIG domain-containing protein [Acidobacteria bacterium]|nr:IPT/TIG domain-containing protein [Acidobacteriota bacterium]